MPAFRQLNHLVMISFLLLSAPAFADFEGCGIAMLTQLQREEALLNRMDAKLVRANLALPGEGICGPTCAFNLFQLIKRETGIQIGEADGVDEIRRLYFTHKNQGKDDIRTGVEIQDLVQLVSSEIRDSQISAKIEMQTENLTSKNLEKLDQRAILTITEFKTLRSHAVLLKAFDSAAKKILVIDPNHPLSDTELSYSEADGKLLVSGPELWSRYEIHNAYLSSIISITEVKVKNPLTSDQSVPKPIAYGNEGFSLSHYRNENLRIFYLNGNNIEGFLEDYSDAGDGVGILLQFRSSNRVIKIPMKNIKNIQLIKP